MDVDEEEDGHAAFLERVGEINTLSHLTKEDLKTYCCFFGKDLGKWHP